MAAHVGVSLSALLVENPGVEGASLIPFGDCRELRPVLGATHDMDEGSFSLYQGPVNLETILQPSQQSPFNPLTSPYMV